MSTTQQLIHEIQSGNIQAREELFRRYAMRTLFLVRARMGAKLRLKEESGDLAQEALRRSLAGLERFEYASDGAFLAFLATKVEQAIHDRVDYWRAQLRDPARESAWNSASSPAGSLPLDNIEDRQSLRPDRIFERREDLDRLARALDTLREENLEYWELVLSVSLQGQSFAEIASQTGTSPDAVKQKSYRAKRALARIFDRQAST